MKKTPNTIDVSFMKFVNGKLKPHRNVYTFHIRKDFREWLPLNAQYAIIGQEKYLPQLVMIRKIYREDIEDTGKKYAAFTAFQEAML